MFFRPKLSQEAIEAYINKLPNVIFVKWFRDGNYIIGSVVVDEDNKSFMTQGTSSDDFINMVNESLFTVYNIPAEYSKVVKTYLPSDVERRELGDRSILHSTLGIKKNQKVLQGA